VADEKPGGTAAPDAAEAAYKAELAERVKKDVEGMGISTEEKKPEEPEKKDGEEPEPKEGGDESEEEKDDDSKDDDTDDGEDKKPVDEKYSKALRRIQKQEAELLHFKSQIIAADRELKPEAAEYWSKNLYYNSPAAAADPKSKAEAERLRREREFVYEANQTRQELERVKRQLEEDRAAQQRQQQDDHYVARLDATIDAYKAKTPLLEAAFKQDPVRTREDLFRIAAHLSDAKGVYEDPGAVVQAWLKERRKLLASFGIKEPVAKTQQVESKKADEKKGPTNGKSQNGQAQAETDAQDAAFKKELRERLAGTYVGD
jgi:hypothetical protein